MKLLSILFLSFSFLVSGYPGIRTSIGIESLTSYTKEILPEVIEKAITDKIPDLTLWIRPLFIPIKLVITDFNVHSLSVDVSKTTISVNNSTKEMLLTLPNVDVFLTAIYNYYIPFRISGEFNLTLTDSTLIIPIKYSITKEGILDVNIEDFQGNASNMIIDVHPNGVFSETFQIFTHLWPLSIISNHIISKKLSSLSTLLNPYVDNYLNSYKYTFQVANLSISGDYHFLDINLDPLYIESSINGSFFLNRDLSTESPVIPPSYLPNFYSQSSVRIQFTEYFFDSLMWSLYASDTLDIYIRSQDVPSSFPYVFTTTGLSKLAPGFDTIYGKNVPVDLECFTYKVPNIDIQTVVSLNAAINCNFLVRLSPTAVQNAFTIITTFQTQVKASLAEVNEQVVVIGSIDRQNTKFVDFYVINSRIGNFSPSKFNTAFNWYVYYLVNNLNKVLEDQGILVPLPKGVLYKNPTFNIYQGAVEISFEPAFS